MLQGCGPGGAGSNCLAHMGTRTLRQPTQLHAAAMSPACSMSPAFSMIPACSMPQCITAQASSWVTAHHDDSHVRKSGCACWCQ
jgi:hypothetical protein